MTVLPPSILVRRGADWPQINHAVVFLAEKVIGKDAWQALRMLTHGGVVHESAHVLQNGFRGERRRKGWKEEFARACESYEALVGWTGERMPK